MSMIKILAIHEARTEHAKEVRKQTGTNDYRDKAIFFRDSFLMQCIGTFRTKDNLLCNNTNKNLRKQRQSRWRLVFQPSLSKARNRRLHQ